MALVAAIMSPHQMAINTYHQPLQSWFDMMMEGVWQGLQLYPCLYLNMLEHEIHGNDKLMTEMDAKQWNYICGVKRWFVFCLLIWFIELF